LSARKPGKRAARGSSLAPSVTAGEPAGATPAPAPAPVASVAPDVSPEARERVLAAIRDLGPDATIVAIQAKAGVRAQDVARIVAAVRAGSLQVAPGVSREPSAAARGLEAQVRAAKGPADLARVAQAAAAAVAGGDLREGQARAIVDACREARRAMVDDRQVNGGLTLDDKRLALVSAEALALGVSFDCLSDEHRDMVVAFTASLLEQENEAEDARGISL
jgi:hypothetical protein